jgi:hypothetical protein
MRSNVKRYDRNVYDVDIRRAVYLRVRYRYLVTMATIIRDPKHSPLACCPRLRRPLGKAWSTIRRYLKNQWHSESEFRCSD